MKNGFHILPASGARWNLLACLHYFALCLAAPAGAAPPAPAAPLLEHREFDAMLEAAFQPPAKRESRAFIVHFTLPGAQSLSKVNWRLGLYRPDGALLHQWRGRHAMLGDSGQVRITWRAPSKLPAGIYELRMLAGNVRQQRPIAIGEPALPISPAAAVNGAARSTARLAGLDVDIIYGNLHSQTNHSDGGGDPGQCHGAQEPRSGAFGPEDAFEFARQHGLDFLMASEHNHMYDGSDDSDPAADPQAARQLYRLGLQSAEQFNASHPGFVAMYGMEWGVISGGGHLNIFNSPALLGWERNSNGEPFEDVVTPKSDYAALYRLMNEQGWIGQFNHPNTSQFPIDGKPLAFNTEGGNVMVLCEVMNTNAFSSRLDEGEPRHSFYEEACGKLLEAGYRLAFSSDQDNHCANWGAAYGNRTGILLPAGATPTVDALLRAIRARHVFATMDKHSAIALTANGNLMGAQFGNRGALKLEVHFNSTSGRGVAAVTIMEGVPGRRGEVKPLPGVKGLRHIIKPKRGPHFYYARITQDDGKQLWSAPVWINQR